MRHAAAGGIDPTSCAEPLATGNGLGNLLVTSYGAPDFNTRWSGAVPIVAVSGGLDGLVGVVEGLVIARMRG